MEEHKVLISLPKEDSYQNRLYRQITVYLKLLGHRFSHKEIMQSSILITAEDPITVAEALSKIPGIDYTAVVQTVSSNYEDVIEAITRAGIKLIFPNETFTIKVDSEGTAPYSSRDIEFASSARLIGKLGEKGVRQDKKNPSKIIYAKIENEIACIYYYKYDGLGGRPIGSKGKVLCLLSDDKESSVATWMIARQGIFPYLMIFDTRPYTNFSYIKRLITIATILREFLPVRRYFLITIKIGSIISRLRQKYPTKITDHLLERVTIRMACAYAEKIGLNIIVSGERISKNDLQTIRDFSKIYSKYNKQVLFPLIGLNDEEIIDYSKRIGVPNYVKIEYKGSFKKSDRKYIMDAEIELEIDQLINEALDNATSIDLKNGYNDIHEILNDYFGSKNVNC